MRVREVAVTYEITTDSGKESALNYHYVPWETYQIMPETTMELKNSYGTYTISVQGTDHSVSGMFEELIVPLLLAAGYAEKSIEDYLDSYVSE